MAKRCVGLQPSPNEQSLSPFEGERGRHVCEDPASHSRGTLSGKSSTGQRNNDGGEAGRLSHWRGILSRQRI